jgi:hypothetical protein
MIKFNMKKAPDCSEALRTIYLWVATKRPSARLTFTALGRSEKWQLKNVGVPGNPLNRSFSSGNKCKN